MSRYLTPVITSVAALAFFVVFALFAGDFWVSTVATRAMIIGITALSLTMLVSMTGLVSFAQAAVAAVAGYTVALLSVNTSGMGIALPLPVAVIAALAAGSLAGLLVGFVALRSAGIYLLMITLALSMSWFYFVSQNTTVFNGFDGVNGVRPPQAFGIDFSNKKAFFALTVACSAACIAFCGWLERTPLGSAFHGLRNAPQRMAALGHDTARLRLVAFTMSGLIASVGGTLNVWYSGQVSPGSTDIHAAVALLIVAVVGGMRRSMGAFVGAIFFVLLENFAALLVGRDRFNLVIGAAFVLIVFCLPGGLISLSRLPSLRFSFLGRHAPTPLVQTTKETS